MTALALSPGFAAHAAGAGYQNQDAKQTLAEGLEEYYARNLGRVARPETLAPGSAELFRCHDLCHVIFGLDTTLPDEGMADIRTLLSCDVGWRRYAEYLTRDPEAKAIFNELGFLNALGVTLGVLPRAVLALIEAFRMKKRWPWNPPAEFETRTLAELREEFGIRLI